LRHRRTLDIKDEPMTLTADLSATTDTGVRK
jgi:hypothetical protein